MYQQNIGDIITNVNFSKNGGNKMINTKRTKIVCTIGPATNDVEILKRWYLQEWMLQD